MDKELSKEIIKMINARKDVKADGEIWLTDEKKEMGYFAFCPIISNGDVIGSSIILSDKTVSDEDFNLLKIISTFLAKYIEE